MEGDGNSEVDFQPELAAESPIAHEDDSAIHDLETSQPEDPSEEAEGVVEKDLSWKGLHSAYEEGKLNNILKDLKTLSRPQGKFTDGEIIAALENIGAGQEPNEYETRLLGLFGRLYLNEAKIAAAADRVEDITATQREADKRQEEVESGEEEDPLDFEFNEGDLKIESSFEQKRKAINQKYAEKATQVDSPHAIREFEEESLGVKETLTYSAEVTRKKIAGFESELRALQAVDNGDFKTARRVEEIQTRLDNQKNLLKAWGHGLSNPMDRKTYWGRKVANERAEALWLASKSGEYGVRGSSRWGNKDYELRRQALRDSSLPAYKALEDRVTRTHTPTFTDVDAFFKAPVLDLMIRAKLEKAMESDDPRLKTYTQLEDGQRVTGKVERLIAACEHAYQAGNSIGLGVSKDLLTPEELKQVREYHRRRKAKAPSELAEAA